MNPTRSAPSDIPKVAVIGSGYWGKNLVRNFDALRAIAAVCDSDDGIRRSLKKRYPDCRILQSFSDVLEDESIEAVVIATPSETHFDLANEALRSGKDVFVEKPLCDSVSKGEALVTMAREKSRILMVGHILWYHPAVLELERMIRSGEFGRIQYVYSNRLNFGRVRREENILWSFAPHDISVIIGLLDEMPESIQAQGGNYLHNQNADVTVSLLTFPSGVKVHIFVSWLHPFKEQKLVVVGDRKMAVFNDTEPKDKLLLYPHSIGWKNHVPVFNKAEAQSIAIETTEPLRLECQQFLESVRTRTPPRTDGEEGLRVLTVLQQCQEAIQSEIGTKPAGGGARSRPFFAHESAFLDEGVEIGEGTRIWHVSHVMKGSRLGKNCRIGQNVVIGPNVTIGDNVKIQNNISVYEGVTLEDDVFCGPSMVFTNVVNPRSEIPRMNELKPTRVRRGATLGANCTIVCGVTVGAYAFVGAGAVITKDVPDYALMLGNPARLSGWMCRCGVRLDSAGVEAHCPACGMAYRVENGGVSPLPEGLRQ